MGSFGAHYAASKAAVIALTRRAAAEARRSRRHGQRGRAGTVDGETVRELAGDQLDALAAETALGRLAAPRRSPGLVSWLLSDASSYVTGSMLVADGGASL